MPYQAEYDVTLPKVIGSRPMAGGKKVDLTESINYVAGSIVLEKDIAPYVLTRLEDGSDDNLSTLLRYVDAAEARSILDQQAQEFASQPTGEGEILHQEERMGGNGSPTADPNVEVGGEPPYEDPPPKEDDSGDSKPGSETSEGDQESESEDSPDIEPETPAETGEEASEDDESQETEDASDGASESTGESEVETDDEGSNAETENQTVGQGTDSETQSDESDETGESEGDEFENMNLVELRAKAKERDISGRSKMNEDALRAALRA